MHMECLQLRITVTVLRDEGYITSSVDSGERAVQLFEQYGARLVVLDINLPDVNGFAVCSKITEFLAKAVDMHMECLQLRITVTAPDSAKQVLFFQSFALIFDQNLGKMRILLY